MTSNEVRADIDRLVTGLLQANLAVAANSPIRRVEGRSTSVTFPNRRPDLLRSAPFGSIGHYLAILRYRQYHILLLSGSVLQLEYEFLDDVVEQHRLCYYPAPFASRSLQELLSEGEEVEASELVLDDVFQQLRAAGATTDNLGSKHAAVGEDLPIVTRSPIRFDFSRQDATPTHPAAHAHLLHEDARVPVCGPLSVSSFSQLVLHRFEPDLWDSAEQVVASLPYRNQERTVTNAESAYLHFNTT